MPFSDIPVHFGVRCTHSPYATQWKVAAVLTIYLSVLFEHVCIVYSFVFVHYSYFRVLYFRFIFLILDCCDKRSDRIIKTVDPHNRKLGL